MSFEKKFWQLLDQRTLSFGAQYRLFAIFALIDGPIGFLILYYGGGQYNESLVVRLIGMMLCIPLLFTERWSVKLKKYVNLYWYSTLIYYLPFLGTYMVFKNHFSNEWLMNLTLGLFWLILLVDWLMFVILLSLGISLGYVFFISSGNELILQQNDTPVPLAAHICSYFYSILIGCLFSRNKAKIDYERTQTIKAIGGTIAHEMRTPLLVVQTVASGLEDHVPVLVEAYQRLQALGEQIKKIPEQVLALLSKGPQTIQKTTRSAFTVIDMLMVNIQENPADREVERCSMKDCVEEALSTYPLSEGEKALISIEITQDFDFLGVKRLMIHVFFNLIKNALYYIKAASKGTISIWTSSDKNTNCLHFKDTGKGVPKDVLPYIFDRFYGRTRNGTGIGLAFCAMVLRNAEGEITCVSEEGEFTEFILSFPKIAQ